jgi:transposase
LPSRYGPHTTVYNRYNRWAKAGVWLKIFEALAAKRASACDDSRQDPTQPTCPDRSVQKISGRRVRK